MKLSHRHPDYRQCPCSNYDAGGRVYNGELTSYSGTGFETFIVALRRATRDVVARSDGIAGRG